MALRSLMRGEFDMKTEKANTGNSRRDKKVRKMRSLIARKRLKAMIKFVGHQALMEKRSSKDLVASNNSDEVSEEIKKLREIKAKMKSDDEMQAKSAGQGEGEGEGKKKQGDLVLDGGDGGGDDDDDGEGPNNPFEVPEQYDVEFVLWLLCLPVSVPCYLTIPNCGWGGKWKAYYLATFFVSLIWISIFAFGELLHVLWRQLQLAKAEAIYQLADTLLSLPATARNGLVGDHNLRRVELASARHGSYRARGRHEHPRCSQQRDRCKAGTWGHGCLELDREQHLRHPRRTPRPLASQDRYHRRMRVHPERVAPGTGHYVDDDGCLRHPVYHVHQLEAGCQPW